MKRNMANVILLRTARRRDALFVRRVRNLPSSRTVSPDTRNIGVLEHLVWWHQLNRSGERVYVICTGGTRLGYVRCRPNPDGFLSVSIALLDEVRGLGLGADALAQAIHLSGIESVHYGWEATVRTDHEASLRLFEKCGFVEHREEQDGHFVVMRRLNKGREQES